MEPRPTVEPPFIVAPAEKSVVEKLLAGDLPSGPLHVDGKERAADPRDLSQEQGRERSHDQERHDAEQQLPRHERPCK